MSSFFSIIVLALHKLKIVILFLFLFNPPKAHTLSQKVTYPNHELTPFLKALFI